MKTAIISVALLATTAAAATPLQVCAALTDTCQPTLMCAPADTTGACAKLPVPDFVKMMLQGGDLYHKATPSGANSVRASLYTDAACAAPLAPEFSLTLDECTIVPNTTLGLPVYVKVAPLSGTTLPPATTTPAAPTTTTVVAPTTTTTTIATVAPPPTTTTTTAAPAPSSTTTVPATTTTTAAAPSTTTSGTAPTPSGQNGTSSAAPVGTVPSVFVALVAVVAAAFHA